MAQDSEGRNGDVNADKEGQVKGRKMHTQQSGFYIASARTYRRDDEKHQERIGYGDPAIPKTPISTSKRTQSLEMPG